MHGNGLSMENLLNLKIKEKASLNNARIVYASGISFSPEFIWT